MGNCCNKLESVEHVDSIEHFKNLLIKDIAMFHTHHKLLAEDKNFKNNQLKEKQVDYLDFVLTNLKILLEEMKEFSKLDVRFLDLFNLQKKDLEELKELYREICNLITLQNQEPLEEKFENLFEFLENKNENISIMRKEFFTTPGN